MRIALVEDDPAQTELIRGWLRDAGHDCHHFGTGAEFLHGLQHESFDLAVLDWGLPDTTGIDLLAELRAARGDSMPVLFVTVRDREEDVVEALSKGADDYMPKPVSRGEMLARVGALGRRLGVTASPRVIDVAPYRLDLGSSALTRDGKPVALTMKEFELAAFLFRNVGRLLSRGHILEQVWGTRSDLNTRTVDTHVSRLRGKLGLAPAAGWRLRSVYQHGYRLERLDREIE
jgi:DNA-binding response OmpR family regulator